MITMLVSVGPYFFYPKAFAAKKFGTAVYRSGGTELGTSVFGKNPEWMVDCGMRFSADLCRLYATRVAGAVGCHYFEDGQPNPDPNPEKDYEFEKSLHARVKERGSEQIIGKSARCNAFHSQCAFEIDHRQQEP